jgi:hypothetical protein
VVEADGELHQSLQMLFRGIQTGKGAPEVFEGFVGLKKLCAVEEVDAPIEILIVSQRAHNPSVFIMIDRRSPLFSSRA